MARSPTSRLASAANKRSATRERSTIGQSTRDRVNSKAGGKSRSYTNLGADMQHIADVGEDRMLLVMKASLQDVSHEANLAAGKGGRMRVDTGFLRASAGASLSGMPSGQSEKPEGAKPGMFPDDSGTSVAAALIDMELGDQFYFGWTAAYARYREIYDGFLEGAMQNWGRIVAFNTELAREEIK